MEKKLVPLLCSECGRILGASFKTNQNIATCAWLCCTCLTDIGRVADTIAIIAEQDSGVYFLPSGLPNVFSLQDVDNLFGTYLISEKPSDPLNLLSWCDEYREKFAKEKISKLLKRG